MYRVVFILCLNKKIKKKYRENDNPACGFMGGKYDAGHWAVVMEKSGGEAVISYKMMINVSKHISKYLTAQVDRKVLKTTV